MPYESSSPLVRPSTNSVNEMEPFPSTSMNFMMRSSTALVGALPRHRSSGAISVLSSSPLPSLSHCAKLRSK